MNNEACFLYNIKGTSTLYGQEQHVQMKEGNGVVMRCGNYLADYFKDSEEGKTEVLAVHFYPETLKEVLGNDILALISRDQGEGSLHQTIGVVKIDPVIQNYIQSLLFFFENPSVVTDQLIALKVKELVLLLINSNTQDGQRLRALLKNLFNPFEINFKEIVEVHIYDKLSLEELAGLTNLSLSTFKKRFVAIYQMSPGQYFKQKRLEKAACLLENTSMRVTEVCYEVGYSDISNFTKAFTSAYGVSPLQFRLDRAGNDTEVAS